MDGLLPAGADRGSQSLLKVVNDRKRKRTQKHETKREERREKLLKQEEHLVKQKTQQDKA
jgi:hypothetical protein